MQMKTIRNHGRYIKIGTLYLIKSSYVNVMRLSKDHNIVNAVIKPLTACLIAQYHLRRYYCGNT